MFIRALRDVNDWIYSLSRGQVVDVEGDFAAQLIDRGLAVAVPTETAIQELTGPIESAVDDPARERADGPLMKRRGRPDKQDFGKPHAKAHDSTDADDSLFK